MNRRGSSGVNTGAFARLRLQRGIVFRRAGGYNLAFARDAIRKGADEVTFLMIDRMERALNPFLPALVGKRPEQNIDAAALPLAAVL